MLRSHCPSCQVFGRPPEAIAAVALKSRAPEARCGAEAHVGLHEPCARAIAVGAADAFVASGAIAVGAADAFAAYVA